MTYSSLTKTTNNLILKINRISTNRQFSKEDIQMANRKMRRHSSGTCKLNPQWDISSSLLKHLLSKTQEVTSVGEDVDKRKPLFTIDGNVDWCCHYGKQFGDSSENQR